MVWRQHLIARAFPGARAELMMWRERVRGGRRRPRSAGAT